jgi:hypothetical protein
MDSKAINKLIRTEVWPILHEQGFSVFGSRSAFAYKPPFINVFSFQSFNSYLAEGLGCTTYSFTPRLGVYVIGSPGEYRVKRDREDRLQPFEYECSFRGALRKRTPVDGFARDDIFYIDPEGRTTAECFQELKHLASEVSPFWFKANNDLDQLLSKMTRAEECNTMPIPDEVGVPRSYNGNRLQSVLLLLKHQQLPTRQSANKALDSISEAMGTILDFSTIQSGRPRDETLAIEMRELWDHLGNFRPNPVCVEKTTSVRGTLAGPIWIPGRAELLALAKSQDEPPIPVSARRQFWPILKAVGFSEFTDRLAHRVSKNFVEVAEFVPMDPAERKADGLPAGLFRLGVGVFWNALREDGLYRKSQLEEPRPIVSECHISNWLVPETRCWENAKTAFDLIEDASEALMGPGLGWLDIFSNHESALSQLQRKDWELFWCYPMMRGYGGNSSSRRLVYMALLEHLRGNNAASEKHLQQAEVGAHTRYPEHLRQWYRSWIDQVRQRLREL